MGDQTRLNSLDKIRKFTAGALLELRAGKMDENRARAIFYGAGILRDILKDCELVIRLDQVESKMEERTNGDFSGKTN